MFANRYAAFLDACVLAPVLSRNLLLSLAEAGFFRVLWSPTVLEETQRTIVRLLQERGRDAEQAGAIAADQVRRMAVAFPEAMVEDFDALLPASDVLPDPGDAHVLAAALKARAAVIVTDNLKDFPAATLARFDLEARSADDFVADSATLDMDRAVATVRRMRERFRRPELTADQFLGKLEAVGLKETVRVLAPQAGSL